MILYLLNFRKHANQTELDQFFSHLNAQKHATQVVTKSAFFQARKQLSHSAFTDLNRQLVDCAYQSTWQPEKWRGFRLCAIDGSSIRLPDEPQIRNHFGVHNGRSGQTPCAMGMASVFYDVLNKVVIDSAIHPRLTSERQCAQDHLQFASQNDLVVFDRGYVSFWLYTYLLQSNIHFCMRAKTHQDLQVKRFVASGKKQAIITLQPRPRSIKTCRQKGLPTAPIRLRLIRVELPNEVEVLVTSLMDEQAYPAGIFKSLYHLRWGVEENYKRLKQWLEIENFSGKSVLSVQQDFFAKIVAANLTALMAIEAQDLIDKKTHNRQRKYQINYAQALTKMKHRIVTLLNSQSSVLKRLIKQTVTYFSQTIEAVREGRQYPRKLKNIKNDIHFPAYKSAL